MCEKYPFSKWFWDSNPQPLEHESPPITTRPQPNKLFFTMRLLIDIFWFCLKQNKKLYGSFLDFSIQFTVKNGFKYIFIMSVFELQTLDLEDVHCLLSHRHSQSYALAFLCNLFMLCSISLDGSPLCDPHQISSKFLINIGSS